jgi:hypothetical protein
MVNPFRIGEQPVAHAVERADGFGDDPEAVFLHLQMVGKRLNFDLLAAF